MQWDLISNNQQYPIACDLVHEESTIYWSWFLYHLRIYVCQNRKGVCIIFDRIPGIIEAMKRVENGFAGEWGIHQFWLLHVHSNFSSAFPSSHLKMLCLVASNTSQLRKFEIAITQIRSLILMRKNGCERFH